MKSYTFKGGIHPPERKELTKDKAIESIFPTSKTVYIPVTQGGVANQILVAAGDSVACGQKIAESPAFMSAPVHASIAGTVKKIETRMITGNIEVPCIVIQSDDSGRTDFMPALDPFICSKEESLQRVKEAGIVGMGGAAFPTHVKLNPPAGKVIEYVLANAAECEPYLTIDERTMLETPDKLIDGIAIAMKITGAKTGIIVIEDNKRYLIPVLQKSIEKYSHGTPISICLCKTKYPQGGEKSITSAVLGKEIPAGGLPADIGCVIDNVGTLCAISDAFREGKPVIERGLTVSGGACETPKNIRVPVGTLVGDLISNEISLKHGVAKIISGGPMMGFAMTNANFPVAKNTSGVLFLTAEETFLVDESPCIGCGRCVDACPCRLTPVMMVRSLKAGDYNDAKRFGLMDCVECGCCSYVCPAKVRLVQHFRIGKAHVRAEIAKQKAESEKSASKTGGK
ncbi:MAG: electron transport complex subunit RsxC [Spirochaetaceae bacterium]|nr:electron transport complex subunit RsxC [Spirochaetaceae bacterium]